MRNFKKYFIILIFLVIPCITVTVYAKQEQEPYTGTVQLNYGYRFKDGSIDVWASIPAVIINEKAVMSIDISQNDFSDIVSAKKEGYKTLGIPEDEILNGAVYAIYNGEGYIAVSEVIKSETILGDVVILKTDKRIGNPVKFSPMSELNDEEIFATGFSNSMMDTLHFAKQDNILKQKAKITSEDGQYVKFSVESHEAFKGSALINNHNELYGLIIGTEYGGTALSVNAIEQILNTYSIIYDTADAIKPVDRTELHSVTDAAAAINIAGYTDESKEYFQESFQKANEVLYDEDSSQAEVDNAVRTMNNAINNLKEKPKKKGNLIIAILISASVVLIVVLAGVIIYIQNKDLLYKLLGVKKKTPENEQTPVTSQNPSFIDDSTPIDGLDNEIKEVQHFSEMQIAPSVSGQPVQEPPQYLYSAEQNNINQNQPQFTENFQGGYIYEDRADAPANRNSGDIADTSVLNSDISSNDEIVGAAYIIRIKTRERFIVTHNQYTIGRDYDADYRIPENPAIGKIHCRFIEAAGQWYIIDNKSKNKTLVNGREIRPYDSVPIYDKSEIVLANEKFIFRYINPDAPFEDSEEVLSSAGDVGTNVLTSEVNSLPYLIIKGRKINITEIPFSVGRSRQSSYKYTNDTNVSRQHFVITKDGNGYYIKDNKSSNGTFLNDEKLEPYEEYVLKDNDKIKVMDDEFEFHI